MTIFSTASGQAVGDACGGGETLGRGATPEASQRAAMKPLLGLFLGGIGNDDPALR